MPFIIVHRDGRPAREVELEKEFTLVGQKSDADINIEDPDGMEERASILQVGDDFIFNELCQSNGTLVNGQQVKKRVLIDRDLITIGEYRMTFRDQREHDKPVGIERELAKTSADTDMAMPPGRIADPLLAAPGKKAERLIYVILGVIVAGMFLASYRSYVERQAADAQAVLANKAFREAKQKEAASLQEHAPAAESPIKPAAPAAETPVPEQRH